MKTKLKRTLALTLAIMVMMVSLATPALADNTNTTFYKVASVGSAYVSNRLSKGESIPDVITSGSGGSLLGYSDEADTDGLISGWISSALSSSSAPFAYNGLRNVSVDGDSDSVTSSALWYYAQYGRMLKAAGLDSTGTEGGLAPFVRGIAGTLIQLAYNVADSVHALFRAIVNVLSVINPFAFMKPDDSRLMVTDYTDAITGSHVTGIQYIDNDSGYVFDVSDNKVDVSRMRGLAGMVGKIYNDLRSYQPFIIGAAFVIMMTSILFTKKSLGEGKLQIKRFIIRACAIVLAIPLCGSIYTTLLQSVTFDLAQGGAADQKVLETFVDFETWAGMYGLSPGCLSHDGDGLVLEGSISVNDGSMTVSDATILNIRKMAYNVNMYGRNRTSNEVSHERAVDIVSRYANGAFFYSSSFEQFAKTRSGFWFEHDGKKYFSDIVEKTASESKFEDAADKLFSGDSSIANGKGMVNIFAYNVTSASSPCGNIHTDSSSIYKPVYGGNGRLSTLAIYNYLTSSFDDTSVTVYSNEKAPSGFVRQSHYSVTLVGTGFNSFLYWLDCLVGLVVAGLIGWIFAISLILSAIRRFVHLVVTMPFALFGSLKSIARLIIYTIMLFVEIVVTILVYDLLMEILMTIPGIIMSSFATILASDGGTDAVSITQGLVGPSPSPVTSTILAGSPSGIMINALGIIIVVLLLSIMFQIMFLTAALKVRKSVVKFIDEMVTEFVEKLLGVKAAPEAGGGGAGGKMAAAAAAGAGAGLAQHALAKSNDSGSDSKKEDTKGVASDGGKSDDGKKDGGKDGGGNQLPPGGGNAAMPGDNATTVEGSETNISDDDSPVLNEESDEQSEMEAAENMESLSEGDEAAEATEAEAEAAALEAGEDAEDGESGADGAEAEGEDGQDAAAEADADADADVGADEALSESDSAEDAAEEAADDAADVQDGDVEAGMAQADTAEEAAAEAKSEAGGSAGEKSAVAAATGSASGSDSKAGGKSGAGTASGKAGATGSKVAKGIAAGDKKAGADSKGAGDKKAAIAAGGSADGKKQDGNGQGNKALAGGASGSVDEAKSRNEAAKARLAALQAASGNAPAGGDKGAALPGKTGGKAVSLPGQDGGKPVAAAGPNGTQPAMASGQKGAALPGGTNTGGKAPVGASAGGSLPAGTKGGAPGGTVPVGGKAGAVPGGNGGSAAIGGSKGVAMPAPSGSASGAGPSAGGAPAGGQVSMPAGSPAGGPALAGLSGGAAPAAPVGDMVSVKGSSQVSVGQSVEATKVSAPAGGGQAEASQVKASSQVAASQSFEATRVTGGGRPAGGTAIAPSSEGQGGPMAERVSVKSRTEATSKQTMKVTQTKFTPATSSGPTPKQTSVAGAAAQAAVAAFMATSDNPAIAAVGMGALSYQQTMRNGQGRVQRGTAIVGEQTTVEFSQETGVASEIETERVGMDDSALIASYDAETAEIEAQIAQLEAQGQMRQSGGQKKLGGAVRQESDEGFVE